MRTEIDNWKRAVVFVEGACVNGSPRVVRGVANPIISRLSRFFTQLRLSVLTAKFVKGLVNQGREPFVGFSPVTFQYISFGVRKFIRNLSCRLMNLIGYPVVRFSQGLGLSLLKPFPPTRALHPGGLSSLNPPELLVPVPNIGFDRSTGDANRLFSIGRGNQGIDSKVDADHRSSGSPFRFRAFKNKKGFMPAGPNLHQTSRQFKIRKFDPQRPRLTVRQEKKSVTNPRPLIGIDHITALDFLPGVLGVLRTFLSQLTSGFYSFEKFTDDLLNRLTVKLRVSSFGPLFPSTFRWPFPMRSTNPKVTLNEIIPEPCGFFAGLVINAPLVGASWREFYFYCAINHDNYYIIGDSCGKW